MRYFNIFGNVMIAVVDYEESKDEATVSVVHGEIFRHAVGRNMNNSSSWW